MNHNPLSNRNGFLTLWVVIVLSLVPVVTLILANYGTVVTKMTRILQSGGTKHQLNVLHDIIASKTLDPDNDGRLEPLAEKTGNLLPDSIPTKKQDEWGTEFRYCTWDLGTYNSFDAAYSQNNVLPPKADLAAKIISAGRDRVFQTNCTDLNSSGDDLVNEIFETSITSVAGAGWVDDGTVVRLINSLDNVGIGTSTPTEKLHVNGAINIGNTTTTSPGSIRWNGVNFEGYNGSSWVQLDGGGGASPPATVNSFAGASCPSGWLKANGAAISRTTYTSLFSATGTTYGAGDGSTTFNLPDLRGEFVRGWDDGRGVDSGRTLGSSQEGTIVHGDNNLSPAIFGAAQTQDLRVDNGDSLSLAAHLIGSSTPATLTGSTYLGVSRPRNVALLYCIKY